MHTGLYACRVVPAVPNMRLGRVVEKSVSADINGPGQLDRARRVTLLIDLRAEPSPARRCAHQVAFNVTPE